MLYFSSLLASCSKGWLLHSWLISGMVEYGRDWRLNVYVYFKHAAFGFTARCAYCRALYCYAIVFQFFRLSVCLSVCNVEVSWSYTVGSVIVCPIAVALHGTYDKISCVISVCLSVCLSLCMCVCPRSHGHYFSSYFFRKLGTYVWHLKWKKNPFVVACGSKCNKCVPYFHHILSQISTL